MYFYSLSDKDISVHLILLQLRTVQSCWRALGEAAGLERETMDMVGVTHKQSTTVSVGRALTYNAVPWVGIQPRPALLFSCVHYSECI